jgi:UDP-N-acetylglucosamine 2-epimerase (non-hydrolysing)
MPVLVLRQRTERPGGGAAGVANVVGANRTMMVARAGQLLTDTHAYATMARAVNPDGHGRASRRIVQAPLDDGAEGAERGPYVSVAL